jgi:hypothetical protein
MIDAELSSSFSPASKISGLWIADLQPCRWPCQTWRFFFLTPCQTWRWGHCKGIWHCAHLTEVLPADSLGCVSSAFALEVYVGWNGVRGVWASGPAFDAMCSIGGVALCSTSRPEMYAHNMHTHFVRKHYLYEHIWMTKHIWRFPKSPLSPYWRCEH